jgi:HD-like signal output (HDOD) protein
VVVRPQRRLLSPFVLAELDYLLATHGGQCEELKLLTENCAKRSPTSSSFVRLRWEFPRTICNRVQFLRTEPVRGTNLYYVRVLHVDGELVRSSPIWIEAPESVVRSAPGSGRSWENE